VNVWVKLRAIRERVRSSDDVDLLEHAPTDIYELMQGIEAVLALHDGHQHPGDQLGQFYCRGCSDAGHGPVAWPCATRVAVERALVGNQVARLTPTPRRWLTRVVGAGNPAGTGA